MVQVYLQPVEITFDKGPDTYGVISGSGSYNFTTKVREANAAIRSFHLDWTGKDDYRNDNDVALLGAKITDVNVDANRTTVTIKAALQILDNDEHYANPKESTMEVLVIACCESSDPT